MIVTLPGALNERCAVPDGPWPAGIVRLVESSDAILGFDDTMSAVTFSIGAPAPE